MAQDAVATLALRLTGHVDSGGECRRAANAHWRNSRAANISAKFLEAILWELRKSGLLVSHRGRNGGFELARPAEQISFADVVRVTDGWLALAPCVNEMAPGKCADCFGEEFCQIRHALLRARVQTDEVLRGYDLAGAAARTGEAYRHF